MSSLQASLLSYLLNSLWQVPLLFAAGWLAARTLRPLGPAIEHRLWVAIQFAQAMLPAVSALPRSIFGKFLAHLSAIYAFLANTSSHAQPQISVTVGPGAALTALRLPHALLACIAIAYATTILYFAARFLWRCQGLRNLRRDSTPIVLTGDTLAYWQRCRSRFAIGDVAITASTSIRCPVTIGLSHKLLLLPAAMVSALPEADLRTVIAHEFAHIQRNDFLKNLVYELLALPISYHPALWLTRDRVMESREIICDQIAATISTSFAAGSIDARSEYARSLLRLASLLVNGMPARTPHAIGIFDANAFERRLMNLTQQPLPIRASRRFVLIAASVALGLATCASALALRLSVNTLPNAADKNTSTAQESVTVSAEEMAANVITKVPPKYPEEAKKEGIQGTVQLNVVIGKDGAVENLTVASGPKELHQSSLDAVQHWIYKPYLLNGNPVEVKTTVNVTYSLAK